MGRISWSQFGVWSNCPHKWKLNYVDKIRPGSDSIYTVYGKAMHVVLQTYLTTMFEKTIKEADEIDLGNMLVDKVKEFYAQGVKDADGKHFSTASQLTEFCIQGAKGLEWFKKRRGNYFNKKGWELLGVELKLDETYKSVDVLGYIDVILRHVITGRIKIIDIKTSTRGWKKEKKDMLKKGQLIFYKKFIADKFDVDYDQIEIEYFIIKRLVWENPNFPISYIQRFEPPSAQVSINKIFKQIDIFIENCFNKDGSYNLKGVYEKSGVMNDYCKWCEFKNKNDLCDRS
jgi:RecB family exonuclease